MNKFKNIIFNFINYIIRITDNKKTLKFLAVFTFLESIIIPVPPDIVLIPITLNKKYSWIFLGIYTTIFSILGGILGYLVGMYFWDILGENIVELYNGYDYIENIKILFGKYGWAVILVAGFSPIPYKIFTIGSGLLGYNFIIFILCSIISRSLRFLTLTYLVYNYGNKGLNFIEKHFMKFTLISSIIFILILLFFIL